MANRHDNPRRGLANRASSVEGRSSAGRAARSNSASGRSDGRLSLFTSSFQSRTRESSGGFGSNPSGQKQRGSQMTMPQRSLKLVGMVFCAIAVIFFLRLTFLQVLVAGEYSAQAEESRTINFDVAPHRGTIYDRNGVVLAVSVDAATIYCNPVEIEDPMIAALHLAEVFGGVSSDYLEKVSQRTTTFVYIKRQVDLDVAQRIKDKNIRGIYIIEDSRREYPNGAVGGQVIGVCDVDGNGICGLELQYDELLRGVPGTYSAERGETGTPIPGGVHKDTQAIDGQDIMVSLDVKMQEVIERELTEEVERVGAKQGSTIMMDGASGEIYAVCSFPYMDPTNLEESLIGSDNVIPITQAIEPGSMFKTVTAFSVLEHGAMQPDDVMFVPASLAADEYVITDAHDRLGEEMSFRKILSDSSNVGISLALKRIGFETFYELIKRCDFAELTGVDFPGEAAGSLDDVDAWSNIGGYNISFGQGLAITPLQLTRFYGALANNGVAAQPHFLISKPQTNEWPQYETKQIITDMEAIEKLNYMLRGVIEEGTGKTAEIPGFDVVGKSSTAEIAENGTYAEDNYIHCFGGYIDNSNSDLTCMVSVNDVPAAGVADVFRDIMVQAIDMYNIVPE